MSNYIKSTSTYTLRKRSQGINGGAIYERDWTTLDGQKLRFGKGKTPLYNDGNFIFTTSSFQLPSKKNKVTEITATYRYDDVKDSKSVVNNVELNVNSNDIRTFAYYGSCVELVKNAVTNIIAMFPASIYSTTQQLEYPIDENNIGYVTDKNNKPLYIIKNPFAIDLLSKSVSLTEYDNQYRFMCETYEDYEINGVNITGFVVDYSFSQCAEDDQWYNFEKYYKDNKDREAPVVISFYGNDNIITKFIGFKYYNEIIFLCNEINIVIKPKQEIIEKYFDELKGFEKQLLNRKSKPLYNNTFITPIEGENGIRYVKRNYKWPTIDDYCIDIESTSYNDFINRLLSMATTYDEIWCDNLYNRMTHESIKNFDWTYTKEYGEGEEQNNIDGGLRMQQILHLIGCVFDETKQYVDGIKNDNKCSYDNMNNLPEALLSDKLELLGWDTTSTIPIPVDNKENSGYVKLTQDFIDENKYKWYGGSSVDIINSSTYDTSFMKRLLLSSKKILSSKGTQEAIDMVMGMFGFGRDNENDIDDFEVTEQSYKVKLNRDINLQNIEKITNKRTDTYNEDLDPFLNLPLKELVYNEIEFDKKTGLTSFKKSADKCISHSIIIPYYDKDKDYLHELYFQSKGGWCQMVTNKTKDINFTEYKETISYLNIVSNVSDLFNTDLTVNKGDIFYVVNLEEYPECYDKNQDCSHFFYLNEENSPFNASSWKNISLKDKDNEYYKKAIYLNDIINTKIGNNPHCGFGFYDNGEEFKEYMSKPFKYLNDKNVVSEDETKKLEYVISNNEIIGKTKTLTENEYNENDYYLNSKVVFIKNNIDNHLYKDYFKKVILHYLLQVIPSTTILILKDF